MTNKRKTETTRQTPQKRGLDTSNDETQDTTLDRGAGSGNDNEADRQGKSTKREK